MEWDSNPRLRRDWCLKPAPWTARPSNQCRPPPMRAGRARAAPGQTSKKLAPAGNQTRVSSVAGTYIITILPAHTLSIPRLELGTSRVLGERHNQLDHTDEPWSIWVSIPVPRACEARTLPIAPIPRCPPPPRRSIGDDERLFFFFFPKQKLKLRHGESNPGHLRDRQRCYQLHHDGRSASSEDRTRDLALTKRMLCQLSYRGLFSIGRPEVRRSPHTAPSVSGRAAVAMRS